MTFQSLQLICFAAGSVIHGVQLLLTVKVWRETSDSRRAAARECVAICIVAFFWQFGNFLLGLAPNAGAIISISALISFPLLFSYTLGPFCGKSRVVRNVVRFARALRYPLWIWTAGAIVAAFKGLGEIAITLNLRIMLFYFVVFVVQSVANRQEIYSTGIGARIRANKAAVLSSGLAAITFIVMLSGYSGPFASAMNLAAMMTSVPFTIGVAYRLYQLPFMDTFVRESITGSILLAAFVASLSVGAPLTVAAAAVALAYAKEPLSRWVERNLMGYAEPIEEQEERIGRSIEGLTQFDQLAARTSEILVAELDAEWIEIDSAQNPRTVHRFEISGAAALAIQAGPRVGGRSYMSRHLRLLRTAALHLATQHERLGREALKDVTAKAQMQALQAQINPHFLFNTLNVLASLIHSDPPKAERLIEQLADIFRYALESTREDRVPLEQEIHFLESYLAIEKARFEDRLVYRFDIDSRARKVKIPPMILQPLIENAIKHGIGPRIEGGIVSLTARMHDDELRITVEDNGIGAKHSRSTRGTGIGLQNIQERLQHSYGKASHFVIEDVYPSGTRIVIEIPVPAGVAS